MNEYVFPAVAIKEANIHLKALHERNLFLERENAKLNSIIASKQHQEQQLYEQIKLNDEKDEKISILEQEIMKLLHKTKDVMKKDLIISQLSVKVKLLYEILKHKPALENIMHCLKQMEDNFIIDIDNSSQIIDTNNNNTELENIMNNVSDYNSHHSNIDLETSL